MAVNAASSSYVNNASSNKGFSGLASGVDTESMVEQLLSGTQSKIDKQEGIKQQLEWKQEIYRDIISQINSFQNKFFSYSSSSNLMSEAFFNAMSALSSSSAFKATATTSASTGSSSMEVRRLATKASITSGSTVSGTLSGKLDKAALQKLIDGQLGTKEDYTVKFKVGDKDVSVDLRDVFVSKDGKSFTNHTAADRDRLIQEKLTEAFKDTGVKATVTGGTVKLVTEGDGRQTITVSGDSGKLGLQRLGLTANANSVNKTSDKTSTLTGKVDGTPKMEFTVTLDDLKKTVSIDLRDLMDENGVLLDSDKIKKALQKGLDAAHGKGQVNIKDFDVATGSFTLEAGPGRKVDIGGGDAAMAALGMKNGQSNRITLGSKLGDLNLGTKLQGGTFRFTINGQEFHFTEDIAIIDAMDIINRSDAGVRMVYRAQDDKFVLEAKESGAGKQIEISQEEGNFINALFGSGVKTGSRMRSKALEAYEIPFSTDVSFDSTKLLATPGDTTLKDLGLTLKDKDGKDIPEETKLSDLSTASGGIYSFDAEKTTITRKVDNKLTLADLGLTLKDKDGNAIAGTTTLAELSKVSDGLYSFTDGKIMRKVDGETTLGDLGLRFKGLDASTKLSELSTLTTEFDYEDGRIILKESFEPKGDRAKEAMLKLFGTDEKIELGVDSGGAAFQNVKGQNAEVKVDGTLTERSSNNFTINGINYDLNDITGSYSDDVVITGPGVTGNKLPDGYTFRAGQVYDENGNEVSGFSFTTADGTTIDPNDLVDVGGVMKKFTGTAAKVTVTQNTDQIMDGIKEFIDEYNKLVKTLNDLVDEDTTYREYPPLTAAQKKEMSEREIELWEEKSKGGLLHRDSTVQTFLQQMRTALYQKPAGAGYALYELGIETGTWEQKGQLTFGTDGEAKLRQLLENDPTGVMKLFTDKEEGLGAKLNEILNQTAKISSSSPGTLVQIAGVKGMGTDKNNSMYEQMKAIDNKIAALKRTYEAEKTRYWKQFNTMEQLISNMNTQSAYLAQMMGG